MSTQCLVPLVQEFHLLTNCQEVPDTKYIPTKLHGGKVIEAILLHNKPIYSYDINALMWQEEILIGSVFIYHFQELLLAFLHNQLNQAQDYLILDKTFGCGMKLSLDLQKNHPGLRVEKYESHNHCFHFISYLNKPEARIMVRMLHHYINRGKIQEVRLDGSVKCNYGTPFFPKVQS